jgi:hypothetical protein
MTLSEFSNTPPGNQNLAIFYNNVANSDISIEALNVSTTDCQSRNLYDLLNTVNAITFIYSGTEYVANITSRTYKSDYFHYEVTPVVVPDNPIADGTCKNISLNPSVSPANFTNGEFDVLISNATNSRPSGYIYDVDRQFNQFVPTNYTNIMNDSATLASVADYSYSSKGITNSRYNGTKTTFQEYGKPAAVAAQLTKGEIYNLSLDPITGAPAPVSFEEICSKSYADREIEDLLFAPNLLNESGSRFFSAPNFRVQKSVLNKTQYVTVEQSLSDSTFKIHGYGPARLVSESYGSSNTFSERLLDFDVGDIILFTGNHASNKELMKVKEVSLETGGTLLPNITASFIMERNYYNGIDELSTIYQNFSFISAGIITLDKVVGDIIYDPTKREPTRLVNKKIWIEDTAEILVLDERGEVIAVYVCPN